MAGAFLYGNPVSAITPTYPTPASGYVNTWICDDKPSTTFKDSDNALTLTWDAGAGNTSSIIGASIHNIVDLQSDTNSYALIQSSPDASAWTTRLTVAAVGAAMPSADFYTVNANTLTYRAFRADILAKAATTPELGEIRLWTNQLTFTRQFNFDYEEEPILESFLNVDAATIGQKNILARRRFKLRFQNIGAVQAEALFTVAKYNPVLFIPDVSASACHHGCIISKRQPSTWSRVGRTLELEFLTNAVRQAVLT